MSTSELTPSGGTGPVAGESEEVASLRRELDRCHQLLQHASAALIATDMDGYITEWTGDAERVFGYTAEDAVGQHLLFLFVDDADLELVMGLGVEQDGRSVTVRQRRGDGSLVWVQMQLGVERDAEGMPCGLMARVIDVNEQVIESEQNRLRGRVFDLMPQPCVITDVQGRAVSANPAWFRMAGAGPEGVLGQTVPLLERRPEAAAFWAGFDALQATTGSWLGERPVPSPDGEERPAYVSIARLVGELGATVGYFITVLGPGADRALSADTGRPRPLRSAAFQAMLSR
jgi:PAS domain S-box-containing protein